ncbi:MAG: hypothetical protein QM749_03530 [Aquabacterium sp.]
MRARWRGRIQFGQLGHEVAAVELLAVGQQLAQGGGHVGIEGLLLQPGFALGAGQVECLVQQGHQARPQGHGDLHGAVCELRT